MTRAAVPRGASDIAGVAASYPTGPSLPRTATVERERIAPSLSPAAAPVTLVDESTPREGLLGVPPRDDSTSSNGPPKSSEQLDAPAMRSGRPQHATTPLGAAPSEWDPGPPPSLDLGWLHVADPRGDDPDAPGNECSVNGTGSSPLATNHEGRIEGRLRERIGLWRQITKDQRVLDLILNGLRMEFRDGAAPPEMHSTRNVVPDELEDWTAQQIDAMLRAGAITTWEDHATLLRQRGLSPGARPHVVSPILVHEKPSSTPENRKYRFIVDARELNEYLVKRKFKLQSLHEFGKQLRRGDYLWSLDLASAYFHVSVHWQYSTYLGFSFRGRYYVFAVLPFGLATSAEAFCLVSSAAARSLREKRLVAALLDYVDDFLGSTGPEPDNERALAAAQHLSDLGFAFNPDKLRLRVTRILESLGYVVNTERMTFSLTERRRARMVEAVGGAWRDRENVVVKDVARVAGHVLSASLAFGLECRLRSRYLLRWVAQQVVADGAHRSRGAQPANSTTGASGQPFE